MHSRPCLGIRGVIGGVSVPSKGKLYGDMGDNSCQIVLQIKTLKILATYIKFVSKYIHWRLERPFHRCNAWPVRLTSEDELFLTYGWFWLSAGHPLSGGFFNSWSYRWLSGQPKLVTATGNVGPDAGAFLHRRGDESRWPEVWSIIGVAPHVSYSNLYCYKSFEM